jgi:hypothetical protein
MNFTRRLLTAAVALLTLPLFSQTTKVREVGLDHLAKLDMETRPIGTQVPLAAAIRQLPSAQRNSWNAFAQQSGSWQVLLDRRAAMPVNAVGQGIPTVPGAGNRLTVAEVRDRLARLSGSAAPAATSLVGDLQDSNGFTLTHMDTLTRDFIQQHAAMFPGVDASSLVLNPGRSGSFGENGYLWYVDYDQVVNGVKVDGSRLTFRYNHGNLVQFGSDNWGRVRPNATTAALTADQALQAAKDYLGNWDARRDQVVSPATLKLVAAVSFDDIDEFERGYRGTPGRGFYNHKLVYDVTLRQAGQTGTYLVRVSALDGSVSEMRDINDYGTVKGGVYPGSASGKGTEIDIPLPFANYGSGLFADAAGNFSGTSGTTTLAGKYVKMVDSCGAISQAANASGVADLSLSAGTDCTTPGTGGAGNTHASRSGYWWVDQIKQKVRSFLPSNSWNNAQVTTNMNLNQTCNAYWNGSTLNFFKSGGGCGNTGELPDVFLHEFGHGLDQNDSTGTSSEGGTGEAYGDTTALTMGHHSCTGPGFLGSNCSGYGDACNSCTGVRELDYHKRASNSPWTAAKSSTSCPAASCVGPMGKECHCESQPLTQGNWDLAQALITKYGAGAGWYKLDQLWYLSRNTAGQGFTKVSASSANGCGSSNWLNTFLVVNDDNGNLADGTPDASQIQAAYNAHGIGCSTLTSTSTQTGASLATPSLSSTSTSTSVSLSWTGGGTSNKIFKNTLGCSYGFIQIASGASASYTDSAVSTAGTYYYAVQAVGASAGSISQFSNCISVTPSGTTTTWSISGTVTDSTSAGISGVSVSTSGGSATTSSTGAWTISGLANGSYTVTPSKAGYSFSPASRAVTVSGADVSGQNFTGTATTTTYSISGSAGTPSATVSFSGASSGSVVADASNNYSISSLVAGTYTVTPSKSGCTFSPASQSVTVGPSATGKNFTATCGGGGGTALSKGVAASSSTNSTSANSDYKDFTLAVPSGASALVINTTSAGDVDLYVKFGAAPSLTVYDCRPYTGSGAETCNFATPSVGTYYIRVYGYATGAVSFTVKGDWTTGTTSYSIAGSAGTASATVSYGAGSVTADASGNYIINGLAAGTYSLSASKSGCTFTPASLSVTVGPSATGKNFTASCGGGDTALSNGVTLASQSVALGAWKFYYITVPAGQTSLTFKTTVSTTDIDIYAKLGGHPSATDIAGGCKAETASGVETCSVANPAAGTYYLGVFGYAASTNYSVNVTYAGSGATVLSNGVASPSSVNGASADASWKDFTITVPAGRPSLTITTTGASGDVDLYTKFGATPSLTVYDCRPYSSSGNETCTVTSPAAGTYYIRVYNYATGNITFNVTGSY